MHRLLAITFLCFHNNFPKWLLSLCMIAKNRSLESKPISSKLVSNIWLQKKVLNLWFLSFYFLHYYLLDTESNESYDFSFQKNTHAFISAIFPMLRENSLSAWYPSEHSIIHKPWKLRTLSKSQAKVFCRSKGMSVSLFVRTTSHDKFNPLVE